MIALTFYKTTNFKFTCSTWSFLKIATIFEQFILFVIVLIVVYFYRLLKVRWMPRSSGLTTWMVTSWRIFAERGWPPWGNEPSRRMSGSVMLVTHCREIRSKKGLQAVELGLTPTDSSICSLHAINILGSWCSKE